MRLLLVVYCGGHPDIGMLEVLFLMPITQRLGKTVRSLRLRSGLSQEELAERADLHRTYIAGIEGGGRNITLKSVDKLARALKVSVADLLSETLIDATPKPTNDNKDNQLIDILLVEDDPDDADLTVAAFTEARIINPVHVVRDGQEALDFLFSNGAYANRKGLALPQVILLDLTLPKISGMEVLRRIKRDPRTQNISVVVVTASRNDADIGECKQLGVEHCIGKPIRFDNFSQITPQLSFLWALVRPGAFAQAN
jgi:CheY-like chemotaxis protein/DNA-binding XRE family transcriptional regulator